MITANELKTKGIACLEENLANQPEAVITVQFLRDGLNPK